MAISEIIQRAEWENKMFIGNVLVLEKEYMHKYIKTDV